MKIPLILITYGYTQKLCTWEEEGVHKLPFFGEPVLADLFLNSFKKHMGSLLEDKEDLVIQVCDEAKYALDMLRMIGMVAPAAVIIYNAAPIGEDPHEAIGKVAGQFQDRATTINKHFELDEATEIFEKLAENQPSDSDEESSEE